MSADSDGRGATRWILVAVAAGVMGAAGTYQFVWTTLSGAVGEQIGALPAQLGTVFTLYVAGQTLVQFPAGSVRDRIGPRPVLLASGLCMFAGFAGLATLRSYPLVAAAYGVGGAGSGMAYTVAVNTPVKWFTDRRGLATGLVTGAFGAASVVVIPLVQSRVETSYTATLLTLATAVGLMGLLAAGVVRDPPTASDGGDETAGTADRTGSNPGSDQPVSIADEPSVGWRSAVRTWQFWTVYAVLFVTNGVGLMLIGRSVAFTNALGLGEGAATTVASAIALADAVGIVTMSGLSDRFGGEQTVGVSLLLCGCALAGAVFVGGRGLALPFVVLVGATAFFRSPVFAIVPALVGEYYGRARSSENYALAYTAKVPGGVFGGTVAGAMVVRLGWSASFYVGAGLIAVGGLLALTLRKPNEVG